MVFMPTFAAASFIAAKTTGWTFVRSHFTPNSMPRGANIGSNASIWDCGGWFSLIALDRMSQN